MSTQFEDFSGEIRLVGTLLTPGATTGDVLTVQSDGSVAPAASGGSIPISVATVDLTAADILALNGSPKTLIAAPAMGQVIVPLSIILDYKYGTTDYTDGSDFEATTPAATAGSGGYYIKFTKTVLLATESDLSAPPTRLGLGPTRAEANGEPLHLAADATEFANGDGTARLTILYQVIELS